MDLILYSETFHYSYTANVITHMVSSFHFMYPFYILGISFGSEDENYKSDKAQAVIEI